MEAAVLVFFQQENVVYIKWHLSENLIHFKFVEKYNTSLLPAEKFGTYPVDSLIKNNLWL